jgi:hypothetical protein
MTALPGHHGATAATGRRGLGGTEGNEILTMATATILTVLLAAEGLTLLNMSGLRSPHMLIGLALIPPLLVKLGSTGYRMVRYYTHARAYREKGPPALPLRVLAPALVATTVAVFASGIVMLVAGHRSDTVMLIHKAGFIAWGGLFAIHFLSYLPRVLRSLRDDWRAARRSEVAGTHMRLVVLAASLGCGLALALLLLPLVTGFHGGHHELH